MKLIAIIAVLLFSANTFAETQKCTFENDQIKLKAIFETGDRLCYASSCSIPLLENSNINVTLKEFNLKHQFTKNEFKDQIGLWHFFDNQFVFGATTPMNFKSELYPDREFVKLSVDSDMRVAAAGGITVTYEGILKLKFSYITNKNVYGSLFYEAIMRCTVR